MIERHHTPRPASFGLEAEEPIPGTNVEHCFAFQVWKVQRFNFTAGTLDSVLDADKSTVSLMAGLRYSF